MDCRFIIETITSRPVIAFVSLFLVIIIYNKPIKSILNRANQLKIGSFEIIVNEIGQSLGISNTISEINDLSYDELKIFLIVCGEDANYYQFSPNNLPSMKFIDIITKLHTKGLIEIVDNAQNTEGNQNNQGNPPNQFHCTTTEKGRVIHKILLESIFYELIETRFTKD